MINHQNKKEAIIQYFNNFRYIEKNLDYSLYDEHIRMLKTFEHFQNCSIVMFDCYKKVVAFTNERKFINNIRKQNLYNNPFYVLDLMDCEDREKILDYYLLFLQFLEGLEATEVKNYKYCYNFKLKDEHGFFRMYISQTKVLELDKNNNIWLVLEMIDMLPDTNLYNGIHYSVMNTSTRQRISLTDNKTCMISDREKEVLLLLSEGMSSKHISDKLFISINTVNNHRKSILEKLNVANSAEAVKYATINGLI